MTTSYKDSDIIVVSEFETNNEKFQKCKQVLCYEFGIRVLGKNNTKKEYWTMLSDIEKNIDFEWKSLKDKLKDNIQKVKNSFNNIVVEEE